MAAIYKAGRIGGAAVYSEGSGSTASTPVGIAIESQAAQALSRRQIASVGTAVEACEALSLSSAMGGLVGVAVDAEAALALSARQIAAVGLAVEADMAMLPATGSTGTADPAAVWDYVLPNGLTAGQNVVEIRALLLALPASVWNHTQ